MGLNYIPHQGRSFLGVTKSFVASGARSNKQTNKPLCLLWRHFDIGFSFEMRYNMNKRNGSSFMKQNANFH